jgi:hypothetical protein
VRLTPPHNTSLCLSLSLSLSLSRSLPPSSTLILVFELFLEAYPGVWFLVFVLLLRQYFNSPDTDYSYKIPFLLLFELVRVSCHGQHLCFPPILSPQTFPPIIHCPSVDDHTQLLDEILPLDHPHLSPLAGYYRDQHGLSSHLFSFLTYHILPRTRPAQRSILGFLKMGKVWESRRSYA